MGNLLEYSTFQLQPQVKKLKQTMRDYGCKHVLMSGSGPTVFAAFAEEQEARAYYKKIKTIYPDAIFSRTVDETILKERVKLYGDK